MRAQAGILHVVLQSLTMRCSLLRAPAIQALADFMGLANELHLASLL